MHDTLIEACPGEPTPLVPLTPDTLEQYSADLDARAVSWIQSTNFKAKGGSHCLIPSQDGQVEAVLLGIESPDDPWCLGALSGRLPGGNYTLQADWTDRQLTQATLGWILGAYRFDRYKKTDEPDACLVAPERCDVALVRHLAHGIELTRDLINTPAENLLPSDLSAATKSLANEYGATMNEIVGDALLKENFPVIHAVGRASDDPPRFLDMIWGDPKHPKVTLVGKGVCFDSGGLNIKSAKGMRYMKKDMGGAAHVLGLARVIMGAGLPIRLRVMVAAVENAISGNALRPGDIIRSRKGLTIEIDNTDAEGRLVMSDCLAHGGEEEPDLMIDFSTLTGAARVALGTELPGMFCNRDDIADGLLEASQAVGDPIWRLPLFDPYRSHIDSRFADLVNSASSPFGGAITAALFLDAFVPDDTPWVHFDLMAWNTRSRAGRPEGGEAMGLRAVFEYLQKRFG